MKHNFYIKPRKTTILSQLESFKNVLTDTIDNSIQSINTSYSNFEISSIKKDIIKNIDSLLKDFNKVHICTKFNKDKSMFNHHKWKFFSTKQELISFIKNNVILDDYNNELSFEEFLKLNNLDEHFNYLIQEENDAYDIFIYNYEFNVINNTFNNIDKSIIKEEFYSSEFKKKFPTISFDFFKEDLRFLK